MSDKVFLDTNLWVYLYSKDPVEKHLQINEIFLAEIQSLVISSQVLGELYNVLVKKKLRTQEQSQEILSQLIDGFDIVEIDDQKVLEATRINFRYGYSYWDSLIIATALQRNCSILYSEDMQHNQVIEGKLRIMNPFDG
jgi:predicted nucleic acid-binding protein